MGESYQIKGIYSSQENGCNGANANLPDLIMLKVHRCEHVATDVQQLCMAYNKNLL